MNLGYHQQLGKMNWGPPTIHACICITYVSYFFVIPHGKRDHIIYNLYTKYVLYIFRSHLYNISWNIDKFGILIPTPFKCYRGSPPNGNPSRVLPHVHQRRNHMLPVPPTAFPPRHWSTWGMAMGVFLTDQNWKHMGITWNWILLNFIWIWC